MGISQLVVVEAGLSESQRFDVESRSSEGQRFKENGGAQLATPKTKGR